MALLTISDAARATGVSRVTLHRYIKAGKLSRTPAGLLDTAELLRIGLVLHPDTLQQPVTVQRPVAPPATPSVTAETPPLERLIEVLQRELDDARAREQAAREREAILLQMLQQVQHQNQRLLEAPRHVPVPRASVSPGRAISPVSSAYDPEAALTRIQALRAQGLSLRQIAAQLHAEEVPTHRGGPWGPSAVRYLLKTYGQ